MVHRLRETDFGFSVRCCLSAMVLDLPLEMHGNRAPFARWLVPICPLTWPLAFVRSLFLRWALAFLTFFIARSCCAGDVEIRAG